MTPDLQAQPSRKARVLIVEDEALIASAIELRLSNTGYDVVGIVDTAEAAVEMTAANLPDLILMDIRLKGDMDGIEAARLIRDRYDVPIVYLTAHTDAHTLQRAKDTGPFGYLAKPVGQASLPTTVEAALWKHRTERELRLQRAWLGTVLRNMADGVIVVDAEGLVQFLNPAAEALTGWTANSAPGQPLSSVLRLFNPELDTFAGDLLPEALAAGQPTPLPSGLQLVHKSGPGIPVEGEIAPSGDGDAVLGAIVSFRDVTARRIEEHQQRQQQKAQALKSLTAGIAHDFSNAFTIIGCCAELLSDALPADSPLLGPVRQISASVARSAEVTRRMLAFTGTQNAPAQLFNLNTIVNEWQDFYRALLGPRIQLTLSLDSGLEEAFGNPADLEEVLVNLLANARDALPSGGCVAVSTANVHLEHGETATPDFIALTVKDNGVGMDRSVADRVFDPFFTTGALGNGTGLGLFIVHNIVTDLGGSIAVDSEPGRGTEFTIYLPAARQRTPGGLTQSPSETAPGRRTVLLADADGASRSVIRRELENRGFDVIEAADGVSALVAARRHSGRIAVLVTDPLMNGISGFQLAWQLARLLPDLKAVFTAEHHGELLSAGALPPGSRFVKKPVNVDELVSVIAELLQPAPEVPVN